MDKRTSKNPPPSLTNVAVPQPSPRPRKAFLTHVREWADALVIAYVLAMFIRTFCVELFKIPTGSMTPTLVGDLAAEFDYDDDGEKDLVILKDRYHIQVFYRKGGEYVRNEIIENPPSEKIVGRKFTKRYDMILVNKFAYWFSLPKRGDIIVFKVPHQIWTRERPIFIKRCVGLPGELIEIAQGHLLVNGKIITQPEAFQHIYYVNEIRSGSLYIYFTYAVVPKDCVYGFGDNSLSSYDGRAWDGIPIDNLKGKAFFRYYPLSKIGFIR
jgi:signal peptidase I